MPILTSQLFPAGDLKILHYIDSNFTATASAVITIPAVDFAKSFVILIACQGTTPLPNVQDSTVTAELTSSTEVTFTRRGATNQVFFQAIVVSSNSLISLQYSEFNLNSVTSASATISAVNTSSNRVFLFSSSNVAENSMGALCRPSIAIGAAITTITGIRSHNIGSSTIGVYIVELKP